MLPLKSKNNGLGFGIQKHICSNWALFLMSFVLHVVWQLKLLITCFIIFQFARAIWFGFYPQALSNIYDFHCLREWMLNWKQTSEMLETQKIFVVILWQVWKTRCRASLDNLQQCSAISKIKIQIKIHKFSFELCLNKRSLNSSILS